MPGGRRHTKLFTLAIVNAVVVAIGLTIAALALTDQGSSALAQTGPPERSSRATEVEGEIARTNLSARLEAAMGDAFAGVWFEPSTAQVHVGVTSADGRQRAEGVAARADLSGTVVETPVGSTWAELSAAQERWSHRLADLFERAQVKTSLSADRNSLDVELGSSVPLSRRTELEREALADSVDVSISVASSPYIRFTVAAQCGAFSKFVANCDPQIVGGVKIEAENGLPCSAGPAVIHKGPTIGTETYILTAGHCIHLSGGLNKRWYAFEKNGTKREIGKSVAYVYGGSDIGVIKVRPIFWAKANNAIPVVPLTAMWDKAKESTPLEVKGQANPMPNTNSCFSGMRSGTEEKCGEIKTTKLEITVEPKKGEPITLKNLAEIQLQGGQKAGKGDSGAPWFSSKSKSTIEGIMSAINEEGMTEESKIVAMQPLELGLEKLEPQTALQLLKESNKTRADAKLAGTQETQHTLGVGGLYLTCGSVLFSGTLTEEVLDSVTLTPSYSECQLSSFINATVTMNECDYVFEYPEETGEHTRTGSMTIDCPAGKEIVAEAGTCVAKIPEQTVGGLTYTSNTTGTDDVLIDFNVTGLTYTQQDGFLCPFTGSGETSNGTYAGTSTVTGEHPETGEPVDISFG